MNLFNCNLIKEVLTCLVLTQMELEDYVSDLESENPETEKKPRNATRNRKWKLETVFENTDEGKEAVANEKTWGFHYSNSNFEGKRKYF